MTKYSNHSLRRFSAELSSNSPIPSGGSMTAAAACLGISLSLMAARIAAKRLGASQKAKLNAKIRSLDGLRFNTLMIVDRDAAIFKELTRLFRQDRRSKTPRSARKLSLGLKKAFLIQAELLELLREARIINNSVRGILQRGLKEDLKISNRVIDAAMGAALITAKLNLGYIKSPLLRNSLAKELRRR
ncbi:MAG: cyclodeaminase/cyclohydrolase family protein [Candidatus Omnitrophica bacterium]|nr:cyclodeaminase/cyclohydrolase family protein [Candidatus Omnitrophota bacterium]